MLANVGLPMLGPAWATKIMAFIPVVLVEWGVLTLALKSRPWRLGGTVAVANLVTTIIGIPVTWFLLVILDIFTGGGGFVNLDDPWQRLATVTLHGAWLVPYDWVHLRYLMWASLCWMMIPLCLASWFIENLVARKMLPDADREVLRRSVRNGNVITYAVIAGWCYWKLLEYGG